MGKKLAFWGDCNGYGYKIIRILEELGGINFSNYGGTEVTSLYYIDEINYIKGTYNGDLDKEKYVIMTYHDFISKYPFQVYDIVYAVDNHEEGKIVEIVWDETKGLMRYLVDFENSTSWVSVDDIFSYEAKDDSKCGTAIKPMKIKSNAVKLVDGKVVDNSEEGKTMNKKLAIVGHPTRGMEVIKLLEMMGGVNSKNLDGKCDFLHFFIDKDNIIWCDSNFNNNFVYFTLEKFLKENPFKVGDKVKNCYGIPVTIKSMSWHDGFETIVYDFKETEDVLCAEDIESVNDADDNTKSTMETITPSPDITANVTDKNNCDIQCPDGYEFYDENGNLIGTKVMMRPKKPVYPDNYEECVRIAKNIHGYDIHIDVPAYGELMESFVKLLICRDAYWKIAGEQMGLGDSWKYDMSKDEFSCAISYQYGCIEKNEIRHKNAILAFPTKEMRDAFYENFKDLIEQCKELL